MGIYCTAFVQSATKTSGVTLGPPSIPISLFKGIADATGKT